MSVLVPSREGLLWEERRFPTDIVDNPFTGDPRPELDEAWHDLLLSVYSSSRILMLGMVSANIPGSQMTTFECPKLT